MTFHGIAPFEHDALEALFKTVVPGVTPSLSFVRQSPAGQVEPTYIHSDKEMGDWTGILYLTPDPPVEDGTWFWKHLPTGKIAGDFQESTSRDGQWASWRRDRAIFNRLLVFRSDLFRSRAMKDNYGVGAAARLIHVIFGTGGTMRKDGAHRWE